MSTKKLSVGIKLKYAVGDFGMAVVTAMLQFFIFSYHTTVIGVHEGWAGTAMLIGKITWDLVNDTLFGYLEDKTKSKLGKRRPYLIFCALPFALSFWLVFSIPKGLSTLAYIFTIIGTFILFDTFHTLINTAYSAMTAELTDDYNERTSLTTYRMVFSVIGYLAGAGLPFFIPGLIQTSLGVSEEKSWSIFALILGLLAAITALIPGLFLKYTPAIEEKPPQMPPVKAILSTL